MSYLNNYWSERFYASTESKIEILMLPKNYFFFFFFRLNIPEFFMESDDRNRSKVHFYPFNLFLQDFIQQSDNRK